MVNLFKLLYFLRLANKRLHWSPSEIKRYQNKRLRYIVKYAYNNVPFYRQLYQENGVNIDEINQIEDLGNLHIFKIKFLKNQDPLILV